MEQLSPNHKRSSSDNLLDASSEDMEMEPLSPNHKRALTRSESARPRMEMGDSSNRGYQFSEEEDDTSKIKSHSQEISSQTGLDPHLVRYLSDDLENKKDSLETSYLKGSPTNDIYQETKVPESNYPLVENRSNHSLAASDFIVAPDFTMQQNNSGLQPVEWPEGEKKNHPFARQKVSKKNHPSARQNVSTVAFDDHIEFPARVPEFQTLYNNSMLGDGYYRRPVSPPLRRRYQRAPSYSDYRENNSIVGSDVGLDYNNSKPPSYQNARMDDFENDNNSIPAADLAPPKPHSTKPKHEKNPNEEASSKKNDNCEISAQLDDVNYTRASNVTLSNFVSVKLSGKSNYHMWKAQMVCLMKSHNMRGLVIKDKELPDNQNTKLRERYEILLNGWLIGSLSEEIIKDMRIYDKGAQGIWDTLEQSYDPYAISPTDSTLLKPRDKKEKQGTDIEPRLIKKLQNATLDGHWWKAISLLNDHKDKGAATWKLNVNHDTLLHVAVRLGNNYFLKKLLDVIHPGNELETVNSEGHTALHIAAIVGNKEAAELLVEKRKELLLIQDKDKNIPLACANLNKQVNLFVYLWGVTKKSDREGSLSENKEKEKENENEKDKDKRKEKETEKEKEKGTEEGKEKEIEKEKGEEGKEKENEKEKAEEGKENEIEKEKENENENEKRKENENEKEKGKAEGKENEIEKGKEKEKEKGIENKNEKVNEKEQEEQKKRKEQEEQKKGQSLLHTAIYSKQYDLATDLVDIKPHLAEQPSTLLLLTRNFPTQISFTETLMYPSLNDVCHKLVKRSFLLLHSLEYLYARAGGTLWKMRRFKNNYYSSLLPELVILLLVPAAVLYLIYRLLFLLILLLRLPFSMLYFILWKVLEFLVVPIKNIEKKRKEHKEAKKFLKLICDLNRLMAKNSKDSSKDSPFDKFYKESLMEAACLDVYEVLGQILKLSSNAMKVKNKDGHNIVQLAVINRSAKVYNLLTSIIVGKGSYRRVMDVFGNNLLHLAGRLAPLTVLSCTSGAALQLQRDLQWREEVKKLMEPTQHTQENVDYETPEMVFSREHANLVKEGEKWMKTTAESCSITAALIITIVFAAAITVPGGSNQDTGIPIFKRKVAFNIFAVADAISLFSASTSLLVFLSILTTRFAEKDFLISLPKHLFIGLCLLFLSTTAMMLAFSTILFLVFCEQRPWMLAPIGGLTCFPIAAIVTLQLPLVIDLYQATFITIFGKEPNEEDEEEENREEEEDKEKLNEEADKEKPNEEAENEEQAKEEETQKLQIIERDNNSILRRLSTACCLPFHRQNKPIPKRSSTKSCLPLHRGNLKSFHT